MGKSMTLNKRDDDGDDDGENGGSSDNKEEGMGKSMTSKKKG